ncbi:MAG: hypothetical protein U1F14_01210 [Steroidobacteraceae bacterium]
MASAREDHAHFSCEDQHNDRKSLRLISGRTADWDAAAADCVCFANAAGGRLLIGIEDGQVDPPPGQVVPPGLLDQLRKRIGELTVNVLAVPALRRAPNGGEFIELDIARSPMSPPRLAVATSCASATSAGR